MTSGAGRAPPTSFSYSPSYFNPVPPRRSSYASVLSGNVNTTIHTNNHADIDDDNNSSSSSSSSSLITPHSRPTPLTFSYAPPPPPRVRIGLDATGMQMNSNYRSSATATASTAGSSSHHLPSYSRKFAGLAQYDDFFNANNLSITTSSATLLPVDSEDNNILTPSYLRNSRYISRLEAAHKAKLIAKRNAAASSSSPSSFSPNPPFSPFSTSYSTSHHHHRIAPSHRGMTYDIIEKAPPGGNGDDNVSHDVGPLPLPSCWSNSERHHGLEFSNGGLEAWYMGPVNKSDQEAASVRADHPMPPQCGLYYFEITILAKPKDGYVLFFFFFFFGGIFIEFQLTRDPE